MADWIIKDTTLKKIADKVRGLNDSSASMLVKNIAENIPEKQDKNISITENGTQTIRPDNGKILGDVIIETNVEGGGKPEQAKTVSIKANGTRTVTPDAGKTLSQVTVITDVADGEIILQEKTVNPTTEQQQVRPDTGYDGLSQVTVEAIQTEEKTVAPGESPVNVYPTSGKYMEKVTVEAVPTEEKTATENGDVYPSEGKFLSKVTVDVPALKTQVKTVEIAENNKTKYIFPDAGYSALSQVIARVAVPGTDFSVVTADKNDVLEGKTFYDKNGSKVTGQIPTYNGEYYESLYPPTVYVSNNTLMWTAVSGADGYKVYKQISASEWELISTQTATEYSLINLPVGYYSLYVKAYSGELETVESNVVSWVKASIKYELENITVKQAPAYFTTDTPATITFEKAFGYSLTNNAIVTFAQQDSFSDGVLKISSPTKSEVLVSVSGVKDTSAQISAGSYTFTSNPTPIQATLRESISFTGYYRGSAESFDAIKADADGIITFNNGANYAIAYNGTIWNYARTIDVTETAHVSADFLKWFNASMEQQLGAPVITISNGTVSWQAVENATSYVVRDGVRVVATTQDTRFYIAPYGNTLGAGTHYINVIAQADYFKESVPSNSVDYTVYALYEPTNIALTPTGGNELFTGSIADSRATNADIYEEVLQGTYKKIGTFTGSTSIQYDVGAIDSMSIGSHAYMARCSDSNGVYADSQNSNSVAVGIYALNWNVTNIIAPSRSKIANNETYFVTITPTEDVALPETISVQGASYTWNVGSNGKGTLTIYNIKATSYTSGVTVTITAVKKAKVEAGTYYWKNIDPPRSSTYIEANFAFKSGGTSYSKMSAGDNDYLKYDDTTVYAVTNGSVWDPETARTITVETDQYIPQAAYDFFFAGLEKQ